MSTAPRLPGSSAVPLIGCAGLFLAMLLTCLMPLLMFDVMQKALQRLHLTPVAAVLLVAGMFVGSLVNIPVHRFTRDAPQPESGWGPLGNLGFGPDSPQSQSLKYESVIAVNLGGCVIPCLIALWQIPGLIQAGDAMWRLGIVAAVNIAACYFAARPVPGIGIMIPGLVSPLVAVLMTWLVCPAEMTGRVAIAYVAGILGPLVGADLLHLKDITRVPVGMLSIGGAGTFDGIVLSGILAALLA